MNRPRARARPRARMAQLGLIRTRAPGIDQDRSEAVNPWLSLKLPETALFFSEISLAHSRTSTTTKTICCGYAAL
jgi:hypothetical protein